MEKLPSINKSMQDIGKQVRSSMPSIKVGVPEGRPLFNPKEEEWIDKFKKWGLILAVAGVLLYAVYRMLFG